MSANKKSDKIDEKSFSIHEARNLVTSSKGKIVAETFLKQATTYAVFRVLFKHYRHKKPVRAMITACAVGKWVWDVYKLACNNIPRRHIHTACLMETAKLLGCGDNEEFCSSRIIVSISNLEAIINDCESHPVVSDRDRKQIAIVISSYEGKKASILIENSEDSDNKSVPPGVRDVVVVARKSDNKTPAYWTHAINSYIIRTQGPGLYCAESNGDAPAFIPDEWPSNITRPHPAPVEIEIEKQVRNACNNKLRRGIIVTGPIGTSKTSSIMSALSKITGVHVIRVRDINQLDSVYNCFSGLGQQSIIVLIDDVDRMTDKFDVSALMRALDGSCTSAPVVTVMTANDPAGKLPQAIYNRRRRVDAIISTRNPNTVEEIRDIVFNACTVCKCPIFEVDEKFAAGIAELNVNHADIAAAIETAKFIENLHDDEITADCIMQFIREQQYGVDNALKVSKEYEYAENEVAREAGISMEKKVCATNSKRKGR